MFFKIYLQKKKKSAAKKFNKKLAAKQKKLNELGLDIKIDDLIKSSRNEPVKVDESVVDVNQMMESLNDSLKEDNKQIETVKKNKKVKK
jgi:hypothetical protein